MEAFAFVVQLLSAISIVVSLVYLAFQIRENTRAMRRAATRDIARDLNEFNRMLIEAPDVDHLMLKATERPQELTAAERMRFQAVVAYLLSSFEIARDYHADGLLGDETIEPYTQAVRQFFENPVVVEWWENQGQFQFSRRIRDLASEGRAAQTS